MIAAGRDIERAGALAERLGNGVGAARLDVNTSETVEAVLGDAGLVVNCIDQAEPHLLRAVIRRGLAYADITARIAFWRAALALDGEARKSGARILLGAGLLPGISNVLARAGAERVGAVERVDTAVLLSMGDSFGAAALDYMLTTASVPFVVMEDGRERVVGNFTDGRRVEFPPPMGQRTVYRFALREQCFYPRTLGARSAATRLALDPPWVTALCAGLMRLGLAPALRQAGFRHAVVRLFDVLRGAYRRQDTYALTVEGQGTQGKACLGLVGESESNATALSAALMARALYEGDVGQPGVWLPEQVIRPAPFIQDLAKRGLHVVVHYLQAGKA